MQKRSKTPLSDRELEQVLHGNDDEQAAAQGRRRGTTALTLTQVRDRIVKAIGLGLDEYRNGSCGPAAIAINRVLLHGKGSYVVARTKGRWSGHVAVMYGGTLFDYAGTCDFNALASFVTAWREEFEIVSGVSEALIKKHFINRHTLPVDAAEVILRHVCAPYIHDSRQWTMTKLRKHIALEIAALHDAQVKRRKTNALAVKRRHQPKKRVRR